MSNISFDSFLCSSFISREYYEKYKIERERKQKEEEEEEKRKEQAMAQVTVNEEQMFDPLSYLCE